MTKLHGASASSGLARGRVRELRAGPMPSPYSAGTSAEEKDRLEKAMADARHELSVLIAGLDAEAAEIIEFQLELLDDASFVATAFEALNSGASALRSWTEAMDREIMDYRSGADEYLSARADGVTDLKDRVVRALLSAADRPANGRSSSHTDNGNPGDEDIVLIADLLSPSRFLELDLSRIRGIATAKSSPTSHVSILARARGIPMIVGCGDQLLAFKEGDQALLDADRGILVMAADAAAADAFARRIEQRDALARIAEAGSALAASTADRRTGACPRQSGRPRLAWPTGCSGI